MTRASRLSVLNDHRRELAEVEEQIADWICGKGTDADGDALMKRRRELQQVIGAVQRKVRR
jgi:hypothetical protein